MDGKTVTDEKDYKEYHVICRWMEYLQIKVTPVL